MLFLISLFGISCQADARAAASKSARERELENDAKELLATFNSDLLSENPSVAAPAPGATVRVLSDRYKGMSEAERAAFRRDQLEQVKNIHNALFQFMQSTA